MARRFVMVALIALVTAPTFAQNKKNERWVATWGTALVARPQPAAGR